MGADPSWATVGWPYSGRVSPKATMAAIANMTAVAANGLPMLRASPLFNTPMKGMPAPANRDHEAKTKYARIRGCSFLDRATLWRALTVDCIPERTWSYYPVGGNRAGIRS